MNVFCILASADWLVFFSVRRPLRLVRGEYFFLPLFLNFRPVDRLVSDISFEPINEKKKRLALREGASSEARFLSSVFSQFSIFGRLTVFFCGVFRQSGYMKNKWQPWLGGGAAAGNLFVYPRLLRGHRRKR